MILHAMSSNLAWSERNAEFHVLSPLSLTAEEKRDAARPLLIKS